MSVVIEVIKQEKRQSHLLTELFYSFGRSDECDFTFKDPKISRVHFCLSRQSNNSSSFWLFDGEYTSNSPSRNGVYVNKFRVVGGQLLKSGDRIDFGNHTAIYLIKSNRNENHLTVY